MLSAFGKNKVEPILLCYHVLWHCGSHILDSNSDSLKVSWPASTSTISHWLHVARINHSQHWGLDFCSAEECWHGGRLFCYQFSFSKKSHDKVCCMGCCSILGPLISSPDFRLRHTFLYPAIGQDSAFHLPIPHQTKKEKEFVHPLCPSKP